ncbi:MAG TPA: AAA family ATPase [Myxococcales bacterium]|nr:AAA family ATPase [Myxococcales bacterium]
MARILAVANQKGGVGKTTTAVNLAASLAAQEQRVLLVDLDPQGNATSGLGIPREQADRPTIYQALLGETDARSVALPTDVPHLFLLPASGDLVGAELELINVENREQRLRQALEPLRDSYDYILIDCPPSLGLLTINALSAADRVLVPLQCEYYALEGLGSLLKTIELVNQRLNRNLQLEGVVLTMYDARNNLARQVATDVQSNLPGQVFETVIPRNVRLSEAPSHGRPALIYDIESKGAQSYLQLATELLQRASHAAATERKHA